jgi:putative membrane protein
MASRPLTSPVAERVTVLAAADVWRWYPHPEVWALVAGLAALYAYAIKVIGPKANRPGETIVTKAQVGWAVAALGTLELAADWPMHDIGEQWLYSVHMVQHLLFSFALPPMVLLAIPTWLARMVIGSGRGYRAVRWLTRVVPATFLFNVVVIFTHAPTTVSHSVANGYFHWGIHLLVVGSALLMWMGVCGPIPELRFSLPLQMVHLFLQSVIPAVPAGWLTFAEKAVYKSYDHGFRIWGMDAIEDQQAAAALMKVLGTTFLWTIIAILFVRFATKSQADDRARGIELDRRSPELATSLTYDQVERAFEEAGAPPREP